MTRCCYQYSMIAPELQAHILARHDNREETTRGWHMAIQTQPSDTAMTPTRMGNDAAPQTHEVFNQPPPLEDYNAFTSDAALAEGARREGAAWAEQRLREIGQRAGASEAIQWGFDANSYPPVLKTHDRYGHRRDEVTFHPAWHELLRAATGWGLHASSWRDPQPGAHVARIVGFYLWLNDELWKYVVQHVLLR